MPNREIINSNNRLPLFTEEVLSFLPEKLPIDGTIHRNTYLSGLEGRPTSTLNQKQAEKAISTLFGFEQPQEFIRMKKGIVKVDSDGNNRIYLYSTPKDCDDAECVMEKILSTGKDLVGLRLIQAYNPNGALVPYLRFDNIRDPGLIRDRKDGRIIGLKSRKETEGKTRYKRNHFLVGDKIELFIDPKSIKAKLYNPNTNRQEEMFLGGGFSFQLHGYDQETNTLTAHVDITFNNRNIRLFGSPEIIPDDNNSYKQEDLCPHQHSFTIDLQRNNNGGFSLLETQSPATTLTELEDMNVFDFTHEVVESFVGKNPMAIANMARATLTLQPEYDLHSMKCMYATILDKQNKPKIITYAFDLESGTHSEEQWLNADADYHGDKTPHYSYFDLDNSRLTEAIDKRHARWKEPNMSMRYLASLLVKGGITEHNLEQSVTFAQLTKDIFSPQELIAQFEKTVADNAQESSQRLHLLKRSRKLATYTKRMPQEFHLQTEVSSNYPPTRILGEIMASAYPNLQNSPEWATQTIFENKSGAINIVVQKNNPQKYFIMLNGDSRLQFCMPVNNHHVPPEFMGRFKSRHDSIQIVKKILNQWHLPELPEVYFSNAKEGD